MPITKDALYYVIEKRALPPELNEKLKKAQSRMMSRRDSGSFSGNENLSGATSQAQPIKKLKSQ